MEGRADKNNDLLSTTGQWPPRCDLDRGVLAGRLIGFRQSDVRSPKGSGMPPTILFDDDLGGGLEYPAFAQPGVKPASSAGPQHSRGVAASLRSPFWVSSRSGGGPSGSSRSSNREGREHPERRSRATAERPIPSAAETAGAEGDFAGRSRLLASCRLSTPVHVARCSPSSAKPTTLPGHRRGAHNFRRWPAGHED